MVGGVTGTPRLKQWMVEQVDSKRYPGLVWEDRKLGMFRIPWKHAGKYDYRHNEDAAIFKAWAKFKGKYKDGDKVDPASWKMRMRCALNRSTEFMEVPQRSQLDSAKPYRVYKIVDDCTDQGMPASAVDLNRVKVEMGEGIGIESAQPSNPSSQLGTMEKAWAKFKGKYKDGDKVDPASWKTRMRCALNKSTEFVEVPQRSQLDISEPDKVYKIVDDSTGKRESPPTAHVGPAGTPAPAVDLSTVKVESGKGVQFVSAHPSSPSSQLGTMEKAGGKYKDGDKVDPASWQTQLRCAQNKSRRFEEVPQRSQLDISEHRREYKIAEDSTGKRMPASAVDLNRVKVETGEGIGIESVQPSCPSSQLGTMEKVESVSSALDSQQMESDSSCDPSSGSEMSTREEVSTESPPLEWSLTPTDAVANNFTISITNLISPSLPEKVATHCTISITNLMLSSLPEKDPSSMFISFYYSGVQVSCKMTRHGCKILSPSRSDASFGSQALEKLCFPPTDAIICPDKRRATEELLTFLERGVMLDSNANGIFIQRLCQGRVFWTGPCALRPDQRNKLEREKVEKLFDRKKFEQDLERYQSEGGIAPRYQVTLCFGEELREAESVAEKLITVQIYQVTAKQLLDHELEIQNASFVLLSQMNSENFRDRVTNALREASSSLYGIS
ncbi:interferon regulatory factor 8-like isoform X2 [Heterodontus francisci]|uniref:interferon regulatory factor 8-like isoform X2 n=1 Tax=Heterodontus francisci TaxID=7792 RepID=UPI00355C00CA